MTNDHLNVIMEDGKPNPDVWAIGDAAQIKDAPLPATAQGRLLLLFLVLQVEPRFSSGFTKGQIRHEEGQQARTRPRISRPICLPQPRQLRIYWKLVSFNRIIFEVVRFLLGKQESYLRSPERRRLRRWFHWTPCMVVVAICLLHNDSQWSKQVCFFCHSLYGFQGTIANDFRPEYLSQLIGKRKSLNHPNLTKRCLFT